MSSVNLFPLATSSDHCIKCSEFISENQSSLQCDTCMLYIHSNCLNCKNPNQQSILNNTRFTVTNALNALYVRKK